MDLTQIECRSINEVEDRSDHRVTNWKVQNGVQEALRRLRWELAQASLEPQESRDKNVQK